MAPLEHTLSQLLSAGKSPLREGDEAQLTLFLNHAGRRMLVEELDEKLKLLMKDWQRQMLLRDLAEDPLRLPNAVQGKVYDAIINFEGELWQEVAPFRFENAADFGLEWNAAAGKLSGVPTESGTLKLKGFFALKSAPEEWHPKEVLLIVNPDPRSLWQEVPTDESALYFKADTATLFEKIGDRHLVMASRRGRSHANSGDFREDDFAVGSSEPRGWRILAISDGAGSAGFAREGARLAVNTAVEKAAEQIRTEDWELLENTLSREDFSAGKELSEALQKAVFEQLKNIPQLVYQRIETEAATARRPISDFNATLVFTLFKTYDFGTLFLTFSVGDCPAAVLTGGGAEVHLLNRIDTGEAAGTTRFVTMWNVLMADDFANRFTCRFFPQFDKLVLMTDGIYDAKFPSEAALTQPQSWAHFWADLAGENEAGHKVDFMPENTAAPDQLLDWLQFWSTGNHDDRTLAIVF